MLQFAVACKFMRLEQSKLGGQRERATDPDCSTQVMMKSQVVRIMPSFTRKTYTYIYIHTYNYLYVKQVCSLL